MVQQGRVGGPKTLVCQQRNPSTEGAQGHLGVSKTLNGVHQGSQKQEATGQNHSCVAPKLRGKTCTGSALGTGSIGDARQIGLAWAGLKNIEVRW